MSKQSAAPSPPLRLDDATGARHMAMDCVATSESARALALAFVERIERMEPSLWPKPRPALPEVCAALLGDLLRNAETDTRRWGYLVTGIGWHDDLKVAIGAGRSLQFIEKFGKTFANGEDDRPDRIAAPAWAKRLRARPRLLALASEHGITPANWSSHFTVAGEATFRFLGPSDISPIALKAARRGRDGALIIGEDLLAVPTNPVAAALIEQVETIQAYLREQRLHPFGFAALRRTFYQVPGEQAGWTLGGRIAALGPDNFQNARASRRASMTINGEQVVEIDIMACGLTILHGLRGLFLDPDVDPYKIPQLPRAVVKAWIVEAFGPAGLPRSWPRRIARDLGLKHEQQLEKRHPIVMLRQRVLDRYPVLDQRPIDWARIQHVESTVLMAVLEELAFRHDIPALPIHDSIIVPATHADFAGELLSEQFQRRVGIRPRLRLSMRGDRAPPLQ